MLYREQVALIMSNCRPRLTLFIVIIATSLAIPVSADSSRFSGSWQLNATESDVLREDLDERTSLINKPGKLSGSIMGMPLPGSKPKNRSHSPLTAKDPAVLRVRFMEIDIVSDAVQLTFPELSGFEASDNMVIGEFRGRKTSFSSNRIRQSYKTTERLVKKLFSIRSDGRLLVQVEIKPRGAKKRVLSRVFDKVWHERLR